MVDPVGAAILAVVIPASILLPWMRKLPAWGSLILANGIVHVAVWMTGMGADFLFYQQRMHEPGPMTMVQMFTSMYLHAGFGHLFGNMLILGFVGYHLEERLGPRLVVATYLATGIAATLVASAIRWGDLSYAALGASGAVFGVLGVLGGAFPRDRMVLPIPLGIVIFQRIPGWVAAAIGGVVQFLMVPLARGLGIGVWAHLGGLGAGLALGMLLARRRPAGVVGRGAPDLAGLDRFATGARQRDLLAHVRATADEPVAQEAWIERFLAEARCPVCQQAPVRAGGRLRCPRCDDG